MYVKGKVSQVVHLDEVEVALIPYRNMYTCSGKAILEQAVQDFLYLVW